MNFYQFQLDFEPKKQANPNPEEPVPSYFTIAASPAIRPAMKLCAVCGDFAKYKCIVCGAFYCKIRCKSTHEETRCIKWNI